MRKLLLVFVILVLAQSIFAGMGTGSGAPIMSEGAGTGSGSPTLGIGTGSGMYSIGAGTGAGSPTFLGAQTGSG